MAYVVWVLLPRRLPKCRAESNALRGRPDFIIDYLTKQRIGLAQAGVGEQDAPMNQPITAVLLAIALGGCASQNRNVVTMDVRPVEGVGSRTVELENGLLLKVLGRNGTLFSIVPDAQLGPGCARGLISSMNVGGGAGGAGTAKVTAIGVRVCPAGQAQGWTRWHADVVDQDIGRSQLRDLPPAFDFATLVPSQSTLAIGAGGGRVDVALPPGAFGEAMRSHPELLASVIVIGVVPRSSNGRYEVVP